MLRINVQLLKNTKIFEVKISELYLVCLVSDKLTEEGQQVVEVAAEGARRNLIKILIFFI